jgi:hypothetical protein
MVLQSQASRQQSFEIRVNDTPLRQVTRFKYLGFTITPTLSFSSHLTRATERARAAAAVVTAILRRVRIRDFRRLGTYLSCYAESQFYCAELLPPSAVDSINSVRSLFVRKLFDLPRTTSHELATILLDVWPAEVVLLKRHRKFLRSLLNHDFPFIRDACAVDRQSLFAHTNGWHNGLVRLLRKIDEVSTVDFDASAQLKNVLSGFSNRSLVNFYFIKDSESQSLTFFTLFPTLKVLDSFRSYLQTLSEEHCRLLILFFASLLRFRFCNALHDVCPLCRKPWFWDHFFGCPVFVSRVRTGPASIKQIESLVCSSSWSQLTVFVRMNLVAWRSVLDDVVFPAGVIDSLGS